MPLMQTFQANPYFNKGVNALDQLKEKLKVQKEQMLEAQIQKGNKSTLSPSSQSSTRSAYTLDISQTAKDLLKDLVIKNRL